MSDWIFDRARAKWQNVTAEAGVWCQRTSEEEAVAEAIDILKKATGHDPESIEVLGFRNGCLVPKPKE